MVIENIVFIAGSSFIITLKPSFVTSRKAKKKTTNRVQYTDFLHKKRKTFRSPNLTNVILHSAYSLQCLVFQAPQTSYAALEERLFLKH